MSYTKQNDCTQRGGLWGWISGNIRRKLTLFVVIILVMVVGLFWWFSVYLLQPAYQKSITGDLNSVLNTVADIINKVHAEGKPVMMEATAENGASYLRLSDECLSQLEAAMASGRLNLDNRCLEIADSRLQNLWLGDNLKPRCFLHPSHETGITPRGVEIASELNGDYVTLVRKAVYEQGGVEIEESGLFILGRTAADASLSIIVAANLERIPQAVNVLKSLLFPLSVILVILSMMVAWLFSRWFTRPLSRVSAAAREMARGNYGVRVEDCGDDEIGELARDFNAMAEEVGRSAEIQRDLLANVSHDLRTPLTLIKGYAETVRDLTGDNPEKRTEQLNVIVDESDRLTALVGSVMELSRMSSGREKTEPVVFDLAQLCDEMAYRYEEICRQQGYKFFFSGEDGCYIMADPNLTERALVNLLGNAISHVGQDGFIGLKVYKTKKGTVRAEVSDHGPGIDQADLPHLFDRFYRSRADAGKPGTGLGLSITKAIFTSMELDYGVDTELGRGSSFWMEAPLEKEPRPVVPKESAPDEGEADA